MKSLFFWIPMTCALLIAWIMLTGSLTLGQLTLGFILSFSLIALSTRLRPDRAYPRRVFAMIKLFFIVLKDVYMSNLDVMLHTLRANPDNQPVADFVNIPLNLRDPHAIALLACIINYVPGTVWSGLTENDYILHLHVFGLESEEEWHRTVHERYEPLLMEIFE
ncbi:MAG: monovalent cation/H+ antiporter subunit E [Alcaligenaceae bacterium]|nr:monovalent cation/H+ antiporter subunit E [Alcaligenaceae bacterium]